MGYVYTDCLQWISDFETEKDTVHRTIMESRDAFVAKDEFDPDEALVASVKK